ncbi:hypothetical protein NECAME_11229 [Necator americanus]|uniref:Uncharacterized protein n=1 Tax=Necator americanus TaxID=51031 RepID=W2T6G0_NECAM|nr:hypothetical protein NECAME_11229 [Necator americanus]ETN77214.1 hypothetical protein NECAME_11229 [Necator americanus]
MEQGSGEGNIKCLANRHTDVRTNDCFHNEHRNANSIWDVLYEKQPAATISARNFKLITHRWHSLASGLSRYDLRATIQILRGEHRPESAKSGVLRCECKSRARSSSWQLLLLLLAMDTTRASRRFVLAEDSGDK